MQNCGYLTFIQGRGNLLSYLLSLERALVMIWCARAKPRYLKRRELDCLILLEVRSLK